MTSSVVRTDAIRPSINDRKLHKWARGIKISYQTRGLLTPVREKNSLPGGFFSVGFIFLSLTFRERGIYVKFLKAELLDLLM